MGWLGSSVSGLAGDLWRRLLRVTPREMTWWITAVIVWTGVVLRARGMWFGQLISLWEDEAAWAMWLIDRPLKDHVLRSLGFMAISQGLVSVFGASERVLRFVPWCAGVGAVLLAPLLATRLFRSTAPRLLFVAIIALHPSAIDLSKEFKPYSVALLVHMLLLLFVLRYADEGRERDLLTTIVIAFFGVLLSQDVVLAYPMVFGLLALHAYRAKRREHVITVFVGAAFAVGLLLAVLHNVAPKLGDPAEGARYWGNKYDVFYVQGPEQGSRLAWTAARSHDLASMLGNRRDLWRWSALSPEALTTLKQVDAAVWTALCAAGLAMLAYQRRFLHLTLLSAPLLVLVGFNYFGFWPLGAFRTNLFAVAYFAGLGAMSFDWKSASRPLFAELVPVVLLVALPFLTLGRSSHSRKASLTANAAFAQAGQELIALQGRRRGAETLLLDSHSCAPWRYYAGYHPERKKHKFARRFTPRCAKSIPAMIREARSGLRKPGARVFVLADGGLMDAFQQRMPSDLRLVEQKAVGKRDAVVARVVLATP
jgi:hypothetical protein